MDGLYLNRNGISSGRHDPHHQHLRHKSKRGNDAVVALAADTNLTMAFEAQPNVQYCDEIVVDQLHVGLVPVV